MLPVVKVSKTGVTPSVEGSGPAVLPVVTRLIDQLCYLLLKLVQ